MENKQQNTDPNGAQTQQNADPIQSTEELTAVIENLKAELEKQKKATANACADASKWKQEFRNTQTTVERENAEKAEKFAELQAKYDEMAKNEARASYKAKFLAVGYSEAQADKRADCLMNNDLDGAISVEKEFLEAKTKEFASESLRNMKKPDTQNGEKTITKEQFDKMSYKERSKLYTENPALYAELVK